MKFQNGDFKPGPINSWICTLACLTICLTITAAQAQRRTPPRPPQQDKDTTQKTPTPVQTPATTPQQRPSRKPSTPPARVPVPQQNQDVTDENINPDLEKKFDEIMQRNQRNTTNPAQRNTPAPRRTTPTPRSRVNPTGNPQTPQSGSSAKQNTDAKNDSIPIDIPPVNSNVSPEKRMYGFSIKGGTYEQLIQGFARQTGLGVLGDTPKDGQVNFVTTEELTFNEALSRIRMLLFNYKPNEPYWLERHETHLAVIRVTDFYRDVDIDHMFQSIEQLQEANVSNEDLVLVIYTPQKGSVSDLKEVRDFMPDYIRVTPLDGNRVSIFAIKSDIDKYMGLIEFFAGKRSDPRSLVRIKVKFISPSMAIEKLRQLIPDLESLTTPGRPRPTPRRGAANDIDTMPEPDVVIIPEDSEGYLLVRAMQDKIEEIKLMLPFVDTKSSLEGPPVIIPVEHGEVNELISTIGHILVLTSSEDEAESAGKPGARTRRPVKTIEGEEVETNDVTLFAHPSGRSIIAIARNEDVINRVRSLVKQFDVPTYVGPERIELKYADPGEVVTTVTAVLGPVNKGKPTSERLHIVADPAGNAIWFTSNSVDADKVREIIAGIDVEVDEIKLHTILLKAQTPTFVSDILKQYDGGSGGATPGKGRKRAIAQAPVAKFTPDDENSRLIVLCTDTEWESYLPIIEDLEKLTDDKAPFVRLELQYLDPQTAIEQLTEMIGIAPGPKGPIRIISSTDSVLVVGASATQVNDIRAFIAEIDKDVEIIQRTFTIQFADTEEIKVAIETLAGSSSQSESRRKPTPGKSVASSSSASDHLIVLQLGDRIVVRTTPETMLDVEKIVNEFDVEIGGTEIRVYDDFPTGADIDNITATLTAFVSVSAPVKRGKRQSTAEIKAVGPKFLPQPNVGKLIVIAESAAFPEIERLLAVLKTDVDHDPINVEFIPVTHADPSELIEMISPMIDIKVSHLLTMGELAPAEDATAVASPSRKPRLRDTGNKSNRYHIDADIRNNRIVIAAPQLIIDIAKELVAQFDIEGKDYEIVFRTVELSNANAVDMIRAIREMRGSSIRRINRPGAPVVKTPTPGSDTLSVVEAPGGSAVVLHGPLDEVDETTEWIKQLDNQSTGGQLIKVFEIKHADILRLVELIMNVVDTPTPPATGKPTRGAKKVSLDDDDSYESNKTWLGQSIYIQADLITSTMIIAASESKMNRIEEIITRFDSEEAAEVMSDTPLPKRVIELQFVDAFDASWELESVLGEVWDPSDDLPTVTSMSSGNSLIVKYHDASRFDEVEDIVKRFVDKLSPEEKRIGKKSFAPPKGLSAEEVALWFKMNHPEIDIEVINIAEKKVDWDIERLAPPKPGRNYPCVLPSALYRMTQAITHSAVGQQKSKSSDDMIRSMLPGSKKDSSEREKPEHEVTKRKLTGEKLKAYYDSEQCIIIMEGKQALLEDVDDWMDTLKEEIENLPVKLDIRIYRVKYIGVYEAQEIIEEMFNATRQQRGAVQAAQQRQLQMQRQQEIARQRLQQQQQQQQAQQQDQQQGRQKGQQQQQDNDVPQLPKEAVRIFANPRDRTLIFRAETSQYPAIEELLATIDQPKPIDSVMHVFKLVKLDAVEVEEMLEDLLGLGGKPTKASPAQQPGANVGGRSSRSRQSTSNQLPQTIMQEVVGKTGVLGVDPEDITITSNEAANSILVMAPKAAIEYIDKIIRELEDMPTDSDEMRTITLQYAMPSKIAETIENALSRGPTNKKGKSTGDTRFTLTPHDETKRLFVSAREEMFARIEKMVTTLDQPQQVGFEMKIYPLKHADARKIHEQMTSLMTDYMKQLGKNTNTMEPFSVEVDDTTNALIVMGSPSVFEFIEKNLAMVDTPANASSPPSIQIYTVQYADPGIVANIINQWAKSKTQGSGNKNISSSNQVIAAAEPATQSVVVSANKANHDIIKGLITELDVEPEGMGVHVIDIENADAQGITQTLQNIFVNTGGRPRGGTQQISISSTPGSKFITIKCDDEVLQDIKEVIAQLDTEGINQPKIIALKFAKVGQVLPTLQDMFASTSGSRGGGGKMQPVINGNEAINAIIVRAESSDLSAIESVITSLDTQEAADKPSFRLIQVKSGVNVTNLSEKIERAINDSQRGKSSSGPPASITATPDVRTGTIIIAGTPTLFDEAEKLITSLQEMGPSGGRVTRVIPISNVGIDDVQRLIDQLTGESSGGNRPRRSTGSRSGGNRNSGSSSSPSRPRTPSNPRRGRP